MMTKETSIGEILLIAIDLDGTLLTSEGTLAPKGARSLREIAHDGVHVVLATTRNAISVQHFSNLLEINDPIICANGAEVWGSPSGPVWAYHTIPQEAALIIAQYADTHDWELSTTVGSMTYWRQRPGQVLGQLNPNVTTVAANSDAVVDDPIRILVSQPNAIDAIRSLCQSRLAEQCHTETYFNPDGTAHSLGIFPPKADKGTALALVLKRLNISPEQVMAIGDDFNDLPMFDCARIRIAMENGPAEVKKKATDVAPSNDKEGVAWALRTFMIR